MAGVAGSPNVADDVALPLAAAGIAAVTALVIANLVALAVTGRAARQPPSVLLRAE
jgi:hypothetical protein